MSICAVPLDSSPVADALWHEGMRCAAGNLTRNRTLYQWSQSARLLCCPVDMWRYGEFAAVLRYVADAPWCLDIASPKLLARYLANTQNRRVVMADIAPYHAEEARWYQRGMGAAASNLAAVTMSANDMGIASSSVPFLYSVSVVEHIGGDGDSRALAEFGRVLMPGGIAAVTIPMQPAFEEVWLDHNVYRPNQRAARERTFFQYEYDWASVERRLIAPSGLQLEALHIWQVASQAAYERYMKVTAQYRSPRALLKKRHDYRHAKRLVTPYAGAPTNIKERAIAAIILKKT